MDPNQNPLEQDAAAANVPQNQAMAAPAAVNEIVPPPAPQQIVDPEMATTPNSQATVVAATPVASPIMSVPSTADFSDIATSDTSMTAQPAAVAPIAAGISSQFTAEKKAHPNNKKFAIIMTLLIAMLLSGAAVYVYITTQDTAQETQFTATDASNATSQQDEVVPESVESSLDATLSEIDTKLDGIDDAADFDEAATSDDALGL